MSEIPASGTFSSQSTLQKPKKPRVMKPKAKPGPGSFRYGTNQAQASAPAAVYGPCSFHVDIDSKSVIGEPNEAAAVRAFCEGFTALPDLCVLRSYGISKGVWTVSLDLASEGRDVDDTFISEMFRRLTDMFDASPVLKQDFGAGKARYRVINVGTTVDHGTLN